MVVTWVLFLSFLICLSLSLSLSLPTLSLSPGFLAYRNYETIKFCLLELLNFEIIYTKQ
jgi:hypothetical protein